MERPHSGETLLQPAGDSAESVRSSVTTGTLPPDLLAQSAQRLRLVALLYAFVFFMAGVFPALFQPSDRAMLFGHAVHWLPPIGSIAVALAVAAATQPKRIPLPVIMTIGLVFEVAASLGIAIAEYLTRPDFNIGGGGPGLSWVAVWTMLFTIVVPCPPRRALVAALASVSTVPLVVGLVMAGLPAPFPLTALQFVLFAILPYLLVVLMAYVGARAVYSLGREVVRAREMGSYRLVERLGAGGMGEVWKARHRLLARPAAIKVVHRRAGADAERHRMLLARFEREAQATARMRSQHTIELYDFGMAPDGAFYYVMELLEGFDLETFITKFGPTEPERAIHLLRQVCDSLGEAHEHGLIHRDVKPANVYLCRYGRAVDFIKVLDFGLVKTRDEVVQEDQSLTGDQTVGGTPAFMSPEQVLGDRAIDGRSDIYAIGCLAYWLVTGQLVFTGRTAMETMMMHASAKPVPPSKRTELPIPPAFDALVMSCLEKDPSGRPATADALSERLAGIVVREPWTNERGKRWWDTHAPVHTASVS